MRKSRRKKDEMRPQYDFSKGVRGKYFKKYQSGTNVIVLSPDVLKVFPDSISVNHALRELMKVARKSAKTAHL